MLMSALRQILNMSPALLIDNNIFNSPLAQHQIIAVGANQHLLSKMMQKALKNNTQLAWTTPHNSILCNRKKWWFSNIYILHIATTWLCYFWHLDFFFFLSQLFIGVLSQNLPHPNTKNNTKYSKKECFYFSVKYDSP